MLEIERSLTAHRQLGLSNWSTARKKIYAAPSADSEATTGSNDPLLLPGFDYFEMAVKYEPPAIMAPDPVVPSPAIIALEEMEEPQQQEQQVHQQAKRQEDQQTQQQEQQETNKSSPSSFLSNLLSPLTRRPSELLQQQQQQQNQQELMGESCTTLKTIISIAEDLNIAFSGDRELLHISLKGTADVAVMAAPAHTLHPLGIELLDVASQIGMTELNSVVVKALKENTPAGPIPESMTSSPSSSSSSSSFFVCTLPANLPIATPINLLSYEAMPHVRPVPLRIQSKAIVKAQEGYVYVATQVNTNSALFVPLTNISLSMEVDLGLQLGPDILNATPSTGVTWSPPNLKWTLDAAEGIKPGKNMLFRAQIPILSPQQEEEDDEDPFASLSTSHLPRSMPPPRTAFKAQSRAGLTKARLQLHTSTGANSAPAPSPYDIQQETRRLYRVTATIE